jgi:signal transduction histidine kinase
LDATNKPAPRPPPVSPRRDGASITVRASLAAGRIALAVEDDGPGFDPGARPAGHGLDLLAGRLAMLFSDRASMGVDSRPGRTAVTLQLPADGPAEAGHYERM